MNIATFGLPYFARSRNILPSLECYQSESEAFDLRYNRFHNERGGKGSNIPLDLRKEHEHYVIKPMWKALGSNLNEENAGRIAHSLEGLKRILHSVESDCGLNARRRWIWVIWVGPIFFPQTPGDNIFFSDIQCKIVFSGWVTSHEIYFFQCRKFFSSGISLQYFLSLSKSVQRVLIYFYSPITQLGLSWLC